MAAEDQPAVKLALMDARLIQEHMIHANLPLHQTVLIAALQLLSVPPVMVCKLLVDILADQEVSAAKLYLHLLLLLPIALAQQTEAPAINIPVRPVTPPSQEPAV